MFKEETSFKHPGCGVIIRYQWNVKTTFQCSACGAWAEDLLDLISEPEDQAGQRRQKSSRNSVPAAGKAEK